MSCFSGTGYSKKFIGFQFSQNLGEMNVYYPPITGTQKVTAAIITNNDN